MNLFFRLLWMALTVRLRSRCAVLDESRLSFRVLPTDLDVNMHLTNSRYFSFMDLSRVDHMVRTGAWKRFRQNGFMPVLGSGSIRYRRPVPPFLRIDVATRVVGCDDRWIYMEHKVVHGETTYAIAVLKAAFIDKKGRVPTERFLSTIGYDGDIPPMTESLAHIRDADEALLDVAQYSPNRKAA